MLRAQTKLGTFLMLAWLLGYTCSLVADEKPKVKIASIVNGEVLAFHFLGLGQDVTLQKAPLVQPKPGELQICEYHLGTAIRKNRWDRWRVEHGQYSFIDDYLPFTSLFRHDVGLLYKSALQSENKKTESLCKHSAVVTDKHQLTIDPRFPVVQRCIKDVAFPLLNEWSVAHVPDLEKDIKKFWKSIGYIGGGLEPASVENAYVDYLPVDEKNFLLIVLMNNELRGWRGEWINPTDTKKPIVKFDCTFPRKAHIKQ